MNNLKRHLWLVLGSIDSKTKQGSTDYPQRPIELANTGWKIRECIVEQFNNEKPTP